MVAKYEVRTEQFEGPLEKLLELIEAKKMEITQLNLAMVTDDFLRYLESLKKRRSKVDAGANSGTDSNAAHNETRPEGLVERKDEAEVKILADFLVVASRLLLIKSKALLPELELSAEEEEDIKDLEKRLKFYSEFKPAVVSLKKLSEGKTALFSRPLLLGRPAIFYPSPSATINTLHRAMENIFQTLQQMSLEFQTIEPVLIKLEEKIEEIVGKIQQGIRHFGHLIKEKSRQEIVVMFLALLHLLREQSIEAEQKEKFSEIVIRKKDIPS